MLQFSAGKNMGGIGIIYQSNVNVSAVISNVKIYDMQNEVICIIQTGISLYFRVWIENCVFMLKQFTGPRS